VVRLCKIKLIKNILKKNVSTIKNYYIIICIKRKRKREEKINLYLYYILCVISTFLLKYICMTILIINLIHSKIDNNYYIAYRKMLYL